MPEQGKLEWATPMGVIGALAVGGVVLAGASFLVANEPAGRALVSVAAIVMLASAVSGAVQRPRLAAHTGADSGITVRKLTGHRRFSGSEITRVRLVRYPRLGRRVPMLEIDVTDAEGVERLLIFGRWDLGTNPHDVFDALAANGLVPTEQR